MIAFAYYGGKQRMAEDIISLMPPHDHYVEPFAGSLAVLLNKPASKIETVNDLNSDITNFFQVLRDYPDQLIPLLEFTTYSRDEFKLAWEECDHHIERARRFFVRVTMDLAKGAKKSDSSFSMNKKYIEGAYSSAIKGYYTKVAGLFEVHQRIKNVQIDNRPAVDVIKRFDSKDTLFYLDPPYVPDTRSSKNNYRFDMTESDHFELLSLLKTVKGKVILSGYDTPVIDDQLPLWNKRQFGEKALPMSTKGRKMAETIWMNFDPDLLIRKQLRMPL